MELHEQISEQGMLFVLKAEAEGTLTFDQARTLYAEALAHLNEDPYGTESFESAWDKTPHTRKVYLVASYHVSRRYGGAEEGGWWYDHHEPLSEAYAQSHERSFLLVGPHTDVDEAWEVARDLNAMEQIGMPRGVRSSIVWRVVDHVPYEAHRAVYC